MSPGRSRERQHRRDNDADDETDSTGTASYDSKESCHDISQARCNPRCTTRG